MAERALHVGIDGRELLGKPTGVGRYLLSILRVWAQDHASPHRYTVFVPADPPRGLQALGESVTWSVHATTSPGTLWEQTRLADAIRTTSPLEHGATVRIRFRLPGSKTEIEAEGRVAWSDRRHGMGLQFEKVGGPDQTAIDEFVDAHFFSSRKA